VSVFQVVIFFIFGFILGGLFVWFLRKSEINTIKENNDELKSAFGNLSKEALDQIFEGDLFNEDLYKRRALSKSSIIL